MSVFASSFRTSLTVNINYIFILDLDDARNRYAHNEDAGRRTIVLPGKDRSCRAFDQPEDAESAPLGGTTQCIERSRCVPLDLSIHLETDDHGQ